MKKLQLLTIAMLFALAGTEFTEAKHKCPRGKEWRHGKCRKKEKDRSNAVAVQPNSTVVAIPKEPAIDPNMKIVQENAEAIKENTLAIENLRNSVSGSQYGPNTGVVGPNIKLAVMPNDELPEQA